MKHLLLVAAGGAIGASLRHLANAAALRLPGPAFPVGTVLVNIAGCLAMGIFIELLARRVGASIEMRLFVATGILGGFTTFSAFSLDFATLFQRGDATLAFVYAAVSVIGSLAAIFIGLALARSLF